ncbi:MAG TPA: outer membrane beta-barrel protein [Flavitalea sp.]|nr:outer membrane beta-barrel protein [Flavitalea sp.]
MSDHEFERQVQQKMDELKFSPSANVWKGVEIELDKGQNRRPGLIWWMAALLVLLAGGGYLFYSNNSSNFPPFTQNQAVKTLNSSDADQRVNNNEVTKPATEKSSETNDLANASKNDLPVSGNGTSVDRQLPAQSAAIASSSQQHINSKQPHPIDYQEQPPRGISEADGANLPEANGVATNTERNQLGTLFPGLMPGISPSTGFALSTDRSLAAVVNVPSGTPKPTGKKSPWSFGATAQVNMSGMNEGGAFNFKRASIVDLSGGMQNSSMLPVNTVIYKPSEIKPGIGFSLGGYAQRSLNKRFDLSFGLGFTRFTNSILVGEKMTTPVAVNGPSSTARLVNPYYTRDGENEYNMHFDFVEVPVNVSYKLNPASKLPVSVNAGLVGGRLVGSNALHFDGSSAGYFKNDELLKKWQLGVNAGIALSIMNKAKHPVTVGPSFRYQMTNSLSNEVGAKRNIMSVGLDARIKLGSFGKK